MQSKFPALETNDKGGAFFSMILMGCIAETLPNSNTLNNMYNVYRCAELYYSSLY